MLTPVPVVLFERAPSCSCSNFRIGLCSWINVANNMSFDLVSLSTLLSAKNFEFTVIEDRCFPKRFFRLRLLSVRERLT